MSVPAACEGFTVRDSKNKTQLAVTLLATVVAMLALPTAQAEADQLNPGDQATVTWTSDGLISSIGPLKDLHRKQMTPDKAKRLLGRGKVKTNRYGGHCTITWKRLGLRLTFTSFGVSKPRQCPKMLQSAGIFEGSSVEWQTQNGLALRGPSEMLDVLFPDNYQSEYLSADQYVLVDHPFGYGDGPTPTLWATIGQTETVTKLNLFVGQAGD